MDLNRLTELELELEHIGDWPCFAKAILALILCGSIAGAWYAFGTRDQLRRLRTAGQAETSLRDEFESKQQQAVNLVAYRGRLAEMEESFAALLRRLPDRTEVAVLLVDVSSHVLPKSRSSLSNSSPMATDGVNADRPLP